jgi:hypothetical protein
MHIEQVSIVWCGVYVAGCYAFYTQMLNRCLFFDAIFYAEHAVEMDILLPFPGTPVFNSALDSS